MMDCNQKKKRRILLIRHGETEWNRLHRFQGRSDIPLNDKGQKQAKAIADSLRNIDITDIYTSPLQRAVDTACYIGSHHPVTEIHTEPALIEMDLGSFEGMEGNSWAENHPDFRAKWQNSPAHLSMPGGENLSNVQDRAVPVIQKIVETSSPGSTSVLCTHNFVITTLLCFTADISLNRFREMRQDTAAVNVIVFDGAWQVKSVNDCSHLAGI